MCEIVVVVVVVAALLCVCVCEINVIAINMYLDGTAGEMCYSTVIVSVVYLLLLFRRHCDSSVHPTVWRMQVLQKPQDQPVPEN